MVIVDSSALIPLIKIGRLDLIKKIFKHTIIPSVVWEEVVVEGKKLGKPIVDLEEEKDWFKIIDVKKLDSSSESIQGTDLSIANLAKERKDVLLTNDAALYYYAISQNIKVWWLTTLLLACVKKKKIAKQEAENILLELVNTAKIHLKSDILSGLLLIMRNL